MKSAINLEDQISLIQKFNLECEFVLNDKTSVITILEESNEFVVVLLLFASGTILQKWVCIKNEDGTYDSRIIYKNTGCVTNIVLCDIENCHQVCNNNNIQCYLCDKNV